MNHMPTSEESQSVFKQFINSLRDVTSVRLTFNQEVAYKYRDLTFINLYNPIIQAALIYFAKQRNENEKTFRFDVKKEDLGVEINKGLYFLSIYQIETSKVIFGTKKITNNIVVLVNKKRNMIGKYYNKKKNIGLLNK